MKSMPKDFHLWEERIADRISSGMTVVEWCCLNGVTKHQYYYWNKRIRDMQKINSKDNFIEVTSILSSDNSNIPSISKSSDFQILIKNITITVPSHFNSESLTELMKVIQKL